MSDVDEILAELIEAKTPSKLVAKVAILLGRAEADRSAIEARRKADRERQSRSRHVTSRENEGVTSLNVMSRDIGEKKIAHVREGARAEELTSKTTELVLKTPPSEGKNDQPKRKSRSRILPDAQPTDRDKRIVAEMGLDDLTFRHEWAKFRSHHVAAGTLMANWSEAWRKWLLGWVERGRVPAGSNGARAGPYERRNATIQGIQELKDELSQWETH